MSLSTVARAERSVEITTVARAHTKYTGLKTAIPATFARELGLEAGDKLGWELDKDGDLKVLIIKKLEGEKKEE